MAPETVMLPSVVIAPLTPKVPAVGKLVLIRPLEEPPERIAPSVIVPSYSATDNARYPLSTPSFTLAIFAETRAASVLASASLSA